MIKAINCNNSNFTKKLTILLEKRRQVKRYDTKIVSSIINDIKKNKIKALLKYEKKFSKNKNIKPSKIQINTAFININRNNANTLYLI